MSTQLLDLVASTRIRLGGTGSDYSLDLPNKGVGYQQSVKFNLGANWSERYNVWITTCLTSAPAATVRPTMDLWIGYSDSATAGTNNWGNCTGAYGAYYGYGSTNADAAMGVQQLDKIGTVILSNISTVQTGFVGAFTPKSQYAYVVWYNNSSVATRPEDVGGVVIAQFVTIVPVTGRLEAPV